MTVSAKIVSLESQLYRYQESLKGTLKDNLANGSSSHATSSADIEKQIKQIFQGIEEGPGSMMVMTFSVPIKSSVADMMMEEMTIRYFLQFISNTNWVMSYNLLKL